MEIFVIDVMLDTTTPSTVLFPARCGVRTWTRSATTAERASMDFVFATEQRPKSLSIAELHVKLLLFQTPSTPTCNVFNAAVNIATIPSLLEIASLLVAPPSPRQILPSPVVAEEDVGKGVNEKENVSVIPTGLALVVKVDAQN